MKLGVAVSSKTEALKKMICYVRRIVQFKEFKAVIHMNGVLEMQQIIIQLYIVPSVKQVKHCLYTYY